MSPLHCAVGANPLNRPGDESSGSGTGVAAMDYCTNSSASPFIFFIDEPPAEGSNAVDVLVGRLRRKLGARNLPDLIRTRRGWGYLLEAGA